MEHIIKEDMECKEDIRWDMTLEVSLRAFFQMAMPLVKEVARTTGKEALSPGIGLLGDVTSRKQFKASLKSHMKEAGRNLMVESVKNIKRKVGGNRRPKHLKRKKLSSHTLVAKRP